MGMRIIAFVLMGLLLGCSKDEDDGTDSPPQEPGRQKGVSISPRSWSVEDYLSFFTEADQAGDLVMWAGDWIQLGDSTAAPATIVQSGDIYHYTPVLIAQFFTQDTGELLRPLTDSMKSVYAGQAAWFAERYHPPYLAFGIEINVLYEHSQTDFNDFAAFFPQVYDSVKLHSPQTQVFTVFQLEKMKGLNGGLFGGVNDTSNATWFLIDQFPDADWIGFTTYPCLVFQDPAEIPDDYYSEVAARTSKPFAITEMGWYTDASIPEWESSEAEQAAFVTRFFAISDVPSLQFVIWSFLYDPEATTLFNSMGLKYRTTGAAKEAWPVWVDGQW